MPRGRPKGTKKNVETCIIAGDHYHRVSAIQWRASSVEFVLAERTGRTIAVVDEELEWARCRKHYRDTGRPIDHLDYVMTLVASPVSIDRGRILEAVNRPVTDERARELEELNADAPLYHEVKD